MIIYKKEIMSVIILQYSVNFLNTALSVSHLSNTAVRFDTAAYYTYRIVRNNEVNFSACYTAK